MVTQISQTYIEVIKAFRDDCEILTGRFNEQHGDSLQHFIDLWYSMGFNSVYDNKYPFHGLEYDFMFDSLQIAKLIMLHEDFTVGLFLIYGLYSLQEVETPICLEFEEFLYILKILRRNKCNKKNETHQLALIFNDLLYEDAFDFVMFAREYDLEGLHHAQMIYNKQYEFADDENTTLYRIKNWVHSFSDHTVSKEMKNLESDYFKLKSKVKAVFPYLNLSLDMVEEDITTTLVKALTEEDIAVTNAPVPAVTNTPVPAVTSIGTKRRLLKNRKMKIKQRHLEDDSKERDYSNSPPTNKIKKGAPRGQKTKSFIHEDINNPDLSVSSDNEVEEKQGGPKI